MFINHQIVRYDFLPRFYQLAIVNILSNIMVPLAGLVSVAFLGHLEAIQYLAGVAATAVLFSYIYRLLNFLRMSTTGVTARAVGEDNHEAMMLVGLRNGLIALVLGLAIVALQYPLRELWFYLLKTEPEIKVAGVAYFNTRIWGAPAVAVNLVLIGWLVGREMSSKVLLMSLVGNIANVILDYFYIIRWGWGSGGAGLSACLSQYLTLGVGLIFLFQEFRLEYFQQIMQKFWNISAFKAIFTFNRDIFIRILANRLTLVIFTAISAVFGSEILAGNALILEVFLITVSFIEGIGFTLETLTGKFEGNGEKDKINPLIFISLAHSLLFGIAFSTITFISPQPVFGLLTSHAEVTSEIAIYIPWLFLVLGFISIAFMLDGYFLGLANGRVPRNSALLGLVVGFFPVSLVSWYTHSNHVLWLSLSVFAMVRAYTVGGQVLKIVGNPFTKKLNCS